MDLLFKKGKGEDFSGFVLNGKGKQTGRTPLKARQVCPERWTTYI